MADIFISYSRSDVGYATKLFTELQNLRFDVWMDVRRLEPGDEWKKTISKELDICTAFIVIMTTDSLNSDYVKWELEQAQARKKSIFPLLLEGQIWEQVQNIQCTKVKVNRLPPPTFYIALLRSLSKISTFYTSRNELHGIEADFDKAKKDILVVGITLRQVVQSLSKPNVLNTMLQKCDIRLLFLTPYTFEETPNTPKGAKNPVVEVSIRQTLDGSTRKSIKEFIKDVRKLKQVSGNNERLQIKGYDNIPATAAILIDAVLGQEDGLIRVEPIFARLPPSQRPSFDVTRRSCPELFDTLSVCYNDLWHTAEDIETILKMHDEWKKQNP